MSAVGAYFNREWRFTDTRNPRILTPHVHRCLKNMYLTLFWAMLSSTVGSFFHLIWDIGGLFTVLTASWTILFLLTPSPLEVRMRLLWLMTAAFLIGASAGLLTKYLFGINQGFVFSSLAGTTIGFGTFWVGAWSTRRRRVYINCWLVSIILLFLWFVIAADIFGGHTARWMPWVWLVLVLYMQYLVVYSNGVMYDARYAFTNLYHLRRCSGPFGHV